ncbi:MAG: hypothetical protein JSS64_07150 [Bacteroidetes bacterium]|nr:hypothetical protein [Bacteroidota bacterium]
MLFQRTFFLLVFFSLLVQFEAQAQRTRRYHADRYYFSDDEYSLKAIRRKPFQRFSVGFNYVPYSGTLKTQAVDYDGTADTVQNHKLKGFGAGIAYTIMLPVARMGSKGLASVYIGLNANYYMFNGDSVVIEVKRPNFTGRETYSGLAGAAFMFGLPVGIDFIGGAEASLQKADRFSFSFGAGFFPMVAFGMVYQFPGINIMAPPYVKAEIGIHAGINWKLRATYIFRSPTSYSYSDDAMWTNYKGNLNVKLESNDQFMLSLLVQPFSWGWH